MPTDTGKYHYVYYLVGSDSRLYIGVRSSTCKPSADKYTGSYKDKSFKPVYKGILKEFSTRKQAVMYEIYLHNKWDVARNPLFANRAKQTSIGFDMTGTVRQHSTQTKEKISVKQRDKSIYSLVNHRTKETYTGTLYNFYSSYKIDKGKIHEVVRGLRKSIHGWTLVGQTPGRVY